MSKSDQTISVTGSRAPLNAVPVVSLHVREEPRADGSGLVIWLSPPARGRIATLLERRFGFNKGRGFELDDVGASYWHAIDGVRSLRDIQATLTRRFSFEEDQSARAVIEFTATLMQRGLISLRIGDGESPG